MTETPSVSVIMVNFNGKADLENCLPSVFNTDYPNFELIIIDNGSTDGSRAILRELCENENKLKIVFSAQNLGFAEANNVAYASAEGEFIALLNCDTVVSSNWLKELIETLTKDKTIGIAQSKLLCLYDPALIDSTGDLVHPCGSSIPRGWGEKDLGQYDNQPEIFSARGAAMIIRRDLIRKIGFFDPVYFMSYEDIDLGWRTRLAGYKVTFAPSSIVYHRGVETCNKTYAMKMYNTYKNQYMTLLKNYEIANVLRFTPQFMVVNLVKILTSLTIQGNKLTRSVPFTFRFKLTLGIIKAPMYVVKNFRSIWNKRMIVQQKRQVPDKVLLRSMSQLSLAAFILNIRTSQLRMSSEYSKANKLPAKCF